VKMGTRLIDRFAADPMQDRIAMNNEF
jgi:hypothetical protein